jgi:hypothetical protein
MLVMFWLPILMSMYRLRFRQAELIDFFLLLQSLFCGLFTTVFVSLSRLSKRLFLSRLVSAHEYLELTA